MGAGNDAGFRRDLACDVRCSARKNAPRLQPRRDLAVRDRPPRISRRVRVGASIDASLPIAPLLRSSSMISMARALSSGCKTRTAIRVYSSTRSLVDVRASRSFMNQPQTAYFRPIYDRRDPLGRAAKAHAGSSAPRALDVCGKAPSRSLLVLDRGLAGLPGRSGIGNVLAIAGSSGWQTRVSRFGRAGTAVHVVTRRPCSSCGRSSPLRLRSVRSFLSH
jgi:hypothetical protein